MEKNLKSQGNGTRVVCVADGVFYTMDKNGACSNRSGGEGPIGYLLNLVKGGTAWRI